MGFDKARFLAQPVRDLFCCPICADVFHEPVQCEQDHIFCRACIDAWLADHDTCPLDRVTLTTAQLTPIHRVIRELLDGLEIECSFVEEGCAAIFKLENVLSHEATCAFNRRADRDRVRDLEKMLCDKDQELALLREQVDTLRKEYEELRISNDAPGEASALSVHSLGSALVPTIPITSLQKGKAL